MDFTTQSTQLLDLVRASGLLRSCEISRLNIHRTVLSKMVAKGQLVRIERGLYVHPDHKPSKFSKLTALASRAPQTFFCLTSALHFHGLVTTPPASLWIGIANSGHVPKRTKTDLAIVRYSGLSLEDGIVSYEVDRSLVRVTSVARTIADCFKFRSRIGIDIGLCAMRDAFKLKLISESELTHYAELCRVSKVMAPYRKMLDVFPNSFQPQNTGSKS